ncbi:MAG: ABC transporter ATP-binding protein [Candidatus Krumholzibacteriota bacterium]|nr:ABC transporter ATP-binding protein [Candidatus Krumholzibacteriota bacterium]
MTVEVKQLSKWYGQVIGVNHLTFTIEPGVTGFLGPNGAGKTTLLRLLTGQLKPSQGTISLNGEEVWNNHRLFHQIGYCPEQDVFWNFHSGWNFVVSMLRMQGYSREEAEIRAEKAVEAVGMWDVRNNRIGSYSKGMRQRIKLAQIWAHDPRILFLDEPLNGLDPIGRKSAIDLIKKMGAGGKTVVVSSHILHEIEEMTDTIILINHGRMLAQGNIYEIRGLIDTHPLQVTIQCDNVNVLTTELLGYEYVQSIQFDRVQNRLTVETNRPDEFHLRLPRILSENKINLQSLWSPDENLDAIFDYLVR